MRLKTWWDYVEDAVTTSGGSYHLLPIAITSQAEGAMQSEGWATGQGKSTFAAQIAKKIYTEFYGYDDWTAEDQVKNYFMGNWTDYKRVIESGMYENRVGVAIADDFDEWAGKHVSHSKAVQWAARDFFKKRPYLGVLLAPMSHIGAMASAWRGLWMFEIKVYELGKYEVQYIKTKTDYRDPEKPYKILDKNTIKPLKGEFAPMSKDFQTWYSKWRDEINKTGFKIGWNTHFGVDNVPKEIPEAATNQDKFCALAREMGISGSNEKLRNFYNLLMKPVAELATAQ